MPALFSCRCAPAERASRRRVFWLSVLLLVGLLPACGPDDPATVDLFFTSDRNGPPDLFHSHNSTISDEPDPVIAPIHRTEPTWSPDGSRIAFVSDSADTSVLYTIGADGTGLKRVPNTPADVTAPEWSPDGSQIAFAASRGLERALYTIRPDGTNRTTLATESKGNPSWSPDGTRIAFVSEKDHDLYTVRANGTERQKVIGYPTGRVKKHDWSPEGGRIVFAVSRTDSNTIHTIRPSGTGRRHLTSGAAEHPTWSPDGTRIAFLSDRDHAWELYTIRPDGTERTQVTHRSGDVSAPDWAPNGSRIAFANFHRDDDYGDPYSGDEKIHTIRVDGTDAQQVTSEEGDSPVWSPDGSRLAFVSNRDGNREIHTIRPDGSALQQVGNVRSRHARDAVLSRYNPLTAPYAQRPRLAFWSTRDGDADIYTIRPDDTAPTKLTEDSASDTDPTWAPNRPRLAFASTRDGNANIYTINLDGTDPTPVTDHETDDTDPAWGPDGGFFSPDARIAFVSTRDGTANIYTMRPDGTGLKKLTDHTANDTAPSWSQDGTRIAFVSDRDNNTEIYTIGRDGENLRRLTENSAQDADPAWAPHVSRIAFASDRNENNVELFWLWANSGTTRQITYEEDAMDAEPAWGLPSFQRRLWNWRKAAVE